MEKKKDKFIKLRVTSEEARMYKEKAAPFNTISNYIRSAVAEFSGVTPRQKTDLMVRLGWLYVKYFAELGHIGGNLNQAVKRINELAQAGRLSSAHLGQLLTVINETKAELCKLRHELHTVTKKAGKP